MRYPVRLSIVLAGAAVAAAVWPSGPAVGQRGQSGKPMPVEKAEKSAKSGKPPAAARAAAKRPAGEAKAFLEEAEGKRLPLAPEAARAGWVQSTYITDDTEILSAAANERVIAASIVYAKKAARFDGAGLPPASARKSRLLT